MEQKTIKIAITLICQGVKMFAVCSFMAMCKSSVKSLIDLGRGIWKHPILAAIIFGLFVYQFVSLYNARAERDAHSISSYRLEQQLDSTQTMSEIIQYRYEHIKDSTGSHHDN